MEQELAHVVNTSSLALSEALSNKAAGTSEVSKPGYKPTFPWLPPGPAAQGVTPPCPPVSQQECGCGGGAEHQGAVC